MNPIDKKIELGYRQHLSFGAFVGSSPYPTWCKDYTDPDNAYMLWISRSYEEIFNVDHKHYEGLSDCESGYWSKEVCEAFRLNDLSAITIGMATMVEHIGSGVEGWDDAIVTKWTTELDYDGTKLVFVYGIARQLDGREPDRVRAELRNQAVAGRYTSVKNRM